MDQTARRKREREGYNISSLSWLKNKLRLPPDLQHYLDFVIIITSLTTGPLRDSFKNSHFEGFQSFSRAADTQAEKFFPFRLLGRTLRILYH